MSDNHPTDPTDIPFKRPRFVVSKLIFILLLAYFAVVVTAGFWWKDRTRSQLQEVKDAIHARGEPVTLEEIEFFRQGQLPPERNAFTLYKQAADALEAVPDDVFLPVTSRYERPSARASIDLLNTYPAWRREYADETADFRDACQPALDLVRQARGMDGVPLLEPSNGKELSLTDRFIPSLFHVRQLSKLSLLAAVMAHDAGDDREAFEHLRDILQIGDRVGEHPTLIVALIQASITALAAECVEHILPTLKIGDGPDDVPLAEVRELGERLVTSQRLLEIARKGMLAERVYAYEMLREGRWMEELGGTQYDVDPHIRAMVPHTVDANHALFLRYYLLRFPPERAAGRYNAPIALAPEDQDWLRQVGDPNNWDLATRMTYYPFSILGPSFDRYYIGIYRSLAMQRMAGLAMLMRLHEAETGQPVATLDDLVPRYLAALPEDPFSPEGEPPRYLADETHPRLYSLYTNQQDDEGDYGTRKSSAYAYGSEVKDWVFFLNGTRSQAEQHDELPPEPSQSTPSYWAPGGQ